MLHTMKSSLPLYTEIDNVIIMPPPYCKEKNITQDNIVVSKDMKIKSFKNGIISDNKMLHNDINTLYNFLSISTKPPKFYIDVEGCSKINKTKDFKFTIDASSSISRESAIKCTEKDINIELKKFIDNKNKLKQVILTSQIIVDTAEFESSIRNLIRESGYLDDVHIRFRVDDFIVKVKPNNKMAKVIKNRYCRAFSLVSTMSIFHHIVNMCKNSFLFNSVFSMEMTPNEWIDQHRLDIANARL